MEPAKKGDWETLPFPEQFDELTMERAFSAEEAERLRLGLVPRQMEDKWFIYYQDDVLHFHRSWTGHEIYQVGLETTENGCRISGIKVNRDKTQYGGNDNSFDLQLLNFLIDRLLLSKDVSFPTPPGIEKDKAPLVQHAHIGYGRSNKE